MAGRPEARGGGPTRGLPPGSAQALVALVLGAVAGVVGVRRDDVVLAVVFFVVALFGGVGLIRLVRR